MIVGNGIAGSSMNKQQWDTQLAISPCSIPNFEVILFVNPNPSLVSSFERSMHVLCLTGTWCGDCALQGAAMHRIAEANPLVDLRFINRNEYPQLQMALPINAGYRVPVTFFMAEDHEPVARYGDRTLSRYRSMARKALPDSGAGVVLAEPPADPVRAVLQEVLDEFERTQLLLRLSPRLRQKHGD